MLGLQNESTYPHEISSDGVRVHETHISYLFLTGTYAYKIKKAIRFGGILNFSTLELRRRYCQAEIKINQLLCKEMYVGIVKIVKDRQTLKLLNPSQNFSAAEYAVKMVEIPQKLRMDVAIKLKEVNEEVLGNLAQVISRFHSVTPTSRKIIA